MAVEDTDELISSLKGLPVPAILTELGTHRFVAANRQAGEVFGIPADELVGSDVLARIHPRDRNAVRAGYAAMASRVIDGYQVKRRIVTPDGTELTVNVSGRRVDVPGNVFGLWTIVPAPEHGTAADMFVIRAAAVVLTVTDHDWQITYMSADAQLLGARGPDLRGFPLLGLVHPSAAPEFLAAAARATTDDLAVTVLTRMRAGPEHWAERYCLMARICEHQPPRLGVVISAVPPAPATGRSGGPLEEYVRHVALEARAEQALDAAPALARLPPGAGLSVRQSEIVARLVVGQRAPDIARSMFLSSSTVRNHLIAIYRKFGVHSQTELLAALLRAFAQRD